ncbi:MAG: hypothetical protein EU529_03830 [Promethearchaeota archaeon]|nr:MAG: hypothetical protein EU529_03830 [Candidatus Lokiarchaeota archaeon]
MGENHFLVIIAEIKQELAYLKQLTQECIEFYDLNKSQLNSPTNLRVFGSFLHDFYTCIENIFRKIAINIDGELPSESTWHSTLLNRMNLNIPNIRASIIDDDLKEILYDYLRFRHIFRNVYGFRLNWDKMGHLITTLKTTQKMLNMQITKFLEILSKIKNSS